MKQLRFLAQFWSAALLTVGTADAQSWTFTDANAPRGFAQVEASDHVLSLSCAARGAAEYDPENLEWRITNAGGFQQLTPKEGQIVAIGISIDGTLVGEGPFLRQDATTLATGLPRQSPFLTRLRSAREVTMTLGDSPDAVTFLLTDLGGALDELVSWCDEELPPPSEPDVVGCAGDLSPTQAVICASPELTALERNLAAAVETRSGTLNGTAQVRFMEDQAAWARLRENCRTAECVASTTQVRINSLSAEAAPAAVASAPRIEPPRALVTPVIPLQPAELASVIWDPKQLNIKMMIEAARLQPSLLDNENLIRQWGTLALGANRNAQGPAELAVARDHWSRSLAANPPGPFLVGQLQGNPMSGATLTDGVLVARQGSGNAGLSRGLGMLQLAVPGVGAVEIRGTSQFDAGKLAVDPTRGQFILDNAQTLQLGVVTQIDAIEGFGSGQGNLRMVGRGQVRFVGLFQPPQQRGAPFDPNTLVAIFPPHPYSQPGVGLPAAAAALGLRMQGGSVYTTGQGNDASVLIRLAGLKKQLPDTLSDGLRNFLFFQLADPQEQDAIIPPFYFGRYGGGHSFQFEPFVDEFERAELLERVDTTLWPTLKSRLPDVPIDVMAVMPTGLGEYDAARGGFPINISTQNLGVGGQGDFPAFRSLPDLLPLPVEKARELVAYLESTAGPGNRGVTMIAQYRVTDVGPTDWDSGQLPSFAVEPVALSLHAWQGQPAGGDPLEIKIAEFDLRTYAGPKRPVASPERIAFWTEINKATRSDGGDLALAAIAVSDDPGLEAELVSGSGAVRNAGQFDRAQIEAALLEKVRSAEKPTKLVLDGTMTLAQYDPQSRSFPVAGLQFSYDYGDLGINPPGVQLVDPSVLQRVPADRATAQAMIGAQQNREARVAFTAWLTPELATQTGSQPVLYARLNRIVLRAPGDDGTGFPPAFVDIEPVQTAQPDATASSAEFALDAPTSLPLDSDYIDLLALRDAPQALNDATYLRMMEDRRLREINAAALGIELPWGRFFDAPEAALNPVQQRVLLDRFKTWTQERAKVLPDAVYLQTTAAGNVPYPLLCWHLSGLPGGTVSEVLPEGIVASLEAIEYRKQAVLLQTYSRVVTSETNRWPTAYFALYGTPAIGALPGARADLASSACNQSRRYRPDAAALEGARHWNALVRVDGAFRTPLAYEPPRIYRDFGELETVRGADGNFEMTFRVSRTEVLDVVQEANRLRFQPAATLTEASLPAPAKETDIFGITPGDPWGAARASAVDRLPEALVLQSDGPPPNFRMATQNTILGPLPQFQALRNGHMFFDPKRNEALALLREAERDPERVLAVASYRVFDTGEVNQEALIGALLRKYGDAPRTEDDNALRASRPGQILRWGERPGCLPNMRDEVRPNLQSLQQSPEYTVIADMARRFRGPGLQYEGGQGIVYAHCAPVVWAFVGEDTENRTHLVVWSLDMALLEEVATLPDPNVKPDGTEGSAKLMEEAADVDL